VAKIQAQIKTNDERFEVLKQQSKTTVDYYDETFNSI
jgi:hypothetical protein